MAKSRAPAAPFRLFPARPWRLLLLLILLGALVGVFLFQRRPIPIPNAGREKLLFPHTEATVRLREAARKEPGNAQAHLELGGALAERGFFMAALREYRAALGAGMQTADLHRRLAQVYERLSRRGEAVQEYRLALQLDPRSAWRAVELGKAYYRDGDSARALHLLNQVPAVLEKIARAQERLPPLRMLGAAYVELGEWERCVQVADKILALAPGEPSALEIKGQVIFSHGQPGRAVPLLRQALSGLEDPSKPSNAPPQVLANLHYLLGVSLYESEGAKQNEEVIAHLSRAVQLDPSLGWAHFSLGRVYADQQKWKEAMNAFIQARAMGVESADLLHQAAIAHEKAGDVGGSLLLKGLYYEAQAEPSKSLAAYVELRKQPAYTEAATLRIARIHRQNRHFVEALAALQPLTEKQPPSVPAYQAIADIYGEQEDFKKRVATLEKLAETAPSATDYAYRELGAWYYHVQRYEEAERAFERCIRLRPENAAYHFALARACLPQTARREKRQKAIEELERALTMNPNHPQAYQLLGQALQQNGRQEEAARAFEHCIDLQPGFGDVYSPLIQAYRSLGRGKEAQEIAGLVRRYQKFHAAQAELERRVITRPRDRAAKLALADFYMHAKDYGKATEQLKKAIRLDPSDSAAHNAMAVCYTQLGFPFEASLASQKAARLRAANKSASGARAGASGAR